MVNKMACAYGKVSRNMVENLAGEFREFRGEIKQEFLDLKKTNSKLYNHLSTRMPPWVTIAFTIGASLITGLIVWGLSG